MNKWDKKAKNYNRYNEDKNSFEQRVFLALNELKINFKDKTLLDIGAGTGVYTIYLAKLCSHVDAIDSSKEMLKILQSDAKSLHVKNISTYVTSWQEFEIKDRYDFALSTMSPAIKYDEDLEKLDKCAKTKIYLGWAGKRETHIIEELFEAHGSTYVAPNGALKVKSWLNKHRKFYQVVSFDEVKTRVRNYEESIENFTWHLDVRGLNPNRIKIENILKNYIDKDGNIVERTISHMNLIVWG